VLPAVNMTGHPVPIKEMRQALIRGLVEQGIAVLDEEDLERFMAQHRVRYTGGIDAVTAQAFKKEAGIDAVFITTLERYTDTNPPSLALFCRLVATGDPPVILWMETAGLSGDEAPGLLGLGLIGDIVGLQAKAVGRLTASIGDFLARGGGTEPSGGEGRFEPKTAYSSSFLRTDRKYAIAVAPFLNRSDQNEADTFLALHFIDQLAKVGRFEVIDPGAVREQFLFFRMIMQEGLSRRDADLIHASLQADLILTGKVAEYQDVGGNPTVAFNVLLFERQRKKVVWESWSYNQGDDDVFFFDWGRITSASVLASKMAQAVVQDMTGLGTIKEGQPPEEQSSPWENMLDDVPAR